MRVSTRIGARRRGFTLVEMLVVMGLMILLAALAAGIGYSGMIGSQRTVGAADRASGWLLISKQRALRDQLPRGVRFIGTQRDGYLQFTEAQYIEVPELWVPNPAQEGAPDGPRIVFVYSHPAGATPGVNNVREMIFVSTRSTFADDINEFDQRVEAGSVLQMPEFGASFRVTAVRTAADPFALPPPLPAAANAPPVAVAGGQYRRLEVALVTDPPVPDNRRRGPDLAAAGSPEGAPPRLTTMQTYKFAFQAQAQPLLGEPLLQLTSGIVIDVRSPVTVGNPETTTGVTTSVGLGKAAGDPGAYEFDIVFSPDGRVVGNQAGLVCLWVRDPDKLPDSTNNNPRLNYDRAGDQALVVISTRTGLIATQPVNDGADPYLFASDGLNNGL